MQDIYQIEESVKSFVTGIFQILSIMLYFVYSVSLIVWFPSKCFGFVCVSWLLQYMWVTQVILWEPLGSHNSHTRHKSKPLFVFQRQQICIFSKTAPWYSCFSAEMINSKKNGFDIKTWDYMSTKSIIRASITSSCSSVLGTTNTDNYSLQRYDQ